MLGSIILIQRGIDEPSLAYTKAQEINKSVDKIQIHAELQEAEQMFRSAVQIYKDDLLQQDRMTLPYAGLGTVYVILGELDKAEEIWKNGLRISFGKNAEYFREWLDKLAEQRTSSTQ
ncbi:MAG: hypothetical protein D3916_15535 [Candidatus Electrothrix sp. MAN1_4]|nr:hypothetical protein [Candidatus Electrothrix sp. MAN1_4]